MTRSRAPFERASDLAQRLCRIESRRGGALARILWRVEISLVFIVFPSKPKIVVRVLTACTTHD